MLLHTCTISHTVGVDMLYAVSLDILYAVGVDILYAMGVEVAEFIRNPLVV